jgi:hypothetical protein
MATSIRPLDVPESISSAVDAPFETALLPDPDLDVSEWADEYRTPSRVSAGDRTGGARASSAGPAIQCISGAISWRPRWFTFAWTRRSG